MIKFIAHIPVYIRFFRFSQGNIIQKIKSSMKYSKLYTFHNQKQNLLKQNNYQTYINKSKKPSLNKFKSIMTQYFKLRQEYLKRAKQTFNDKQEIKNTILQNFIKKCFQKLSLFYQSLENVVEGRREVINNQNFVFDDGQSVNDKKEKFQKFIQKLFGKIQKKISKQNQQSK